MVGQVMILRRRAGGRAGAGGRLSKQAVGSNESVSVYLTRLVTSLSDAENLHIVKYFEDAFQRYHIHKHTNAHSMFWRHVWQWNIEYI